MSTFSIKRKLGVHRMTHAAEKAYECSHGDKTITVKGNNDINTMTHTDEKPYKCSYCDKAFTGERESPYTHEESHWGKVLSVHPL